MPFYQLVYQLHFSYKRPELFFLGVLNTDYTSGMTKTTCAKDADTELFGVSENESKIFLLNLDGNRKGIYSVCGGNDNLVPIVPSTYITIGSGNYNLHMVSGKVCFTPNNTAHDVYWKIVKTL